MVPAWNALQPNLWHTGLGISSFGPAEKWVSLRGQPILRASFKRVVSVLTFFLCKAASCVDHKIAKFLFYENRNDPYAKGGTSGVRRLAGWTKHVAEGVAHGSGSACERKNSERKGGR